MMRFPRACEYVREYDHRRSKVRGGAPGEHRRAGRKGERVSDRWGPGWVSVVEGFIAAFRGTGSG